VALTAGRATLDRLRTSPTAARKAGLAVNADGHERSAFELLSYPDMEAAHLVPLWPEIAEIAPQILDQLTVDAQYAVYLQRQEADIAAVKRDESREIPDWLDYAVLPGLSMEMRQKLGQQRPATIAQAQAIDGVTPAAITLILSIVRRGSLRQAG
jgi:tRNA uridine 5-carboxymethylaminomethyl modification enzyme